jgi:hypothetical protein
MRLLPVSAVGSVEEVIWLPAGGIPGGWTTRGPDPLAFDSIGNTYQSIGAGRLFGASSTAVVRHHPGLRPDTVTQLTQRQTKALQVNRNGTGTYQDVLFSPEDAWVVSPDGWVAVARAAPYHVEWIPPAGAVVAGPNVHHHPVRISPAEKELVASGTAGSRGRTEVRLVLVDPNGAPPPSDRPVPMPVNELLFAKSKAPVNVRDGRWPLPDEHGNIWVERSLPAELEVSRFDVFDRAGHLIDRVELAAGFRLVGFDPRWLYAVRRDADDLEYLNRFAYIR